MTGGTMLAVIGFAVLVSVITIVVVGIVQREFHREIENDSQQLRDEIDRLRVLTDILGKDISSDDREPDRE